MFLFKAQVYMWLFPFICVCQIVKVCRMEVQQQESGCLWLTCSRTQTTASTSEGVTLRAVLRACRWLLLHSQQVHTPLGQKQWHSKVKYSLTLKGLHQISVLALKSGYIEWAFDVVLNLLQEHFNSISGLWRSAALFFISILCLVLKKYWSWSSCNSTILYIIVLLWFFWTTIILYLFFWIPINL